MTSRQKLVTLSLVMLLCLAAAPLHTQTFTDLYHFSCRTGGCVPAYVQLTQGPDGNLYGTTTAGGSYNLGTIFMITPSGTYTDLWDFDEVTGSFPVPGLTLASDGNFYGAATAGGTNTCGTGHCGTLFRFTPPCTLPPCKPTVLHDFNGTDGKFPWAGPVEANDGKIDGLYGVTNVATTYRVTLPGGTFTKLPNAPGASFANLLLASDGNLYGTTSTGGTAGNGTVFRMTTPGGTIKIIHSFSGPDGAEPIGPLIQGSDGNLYGTTASGGVNNTGEVFKMTLSGTLAWSFSFDSLSGIINNDGTDVTAGLLAASDGYLYGANAGGGSFGYGTLYQITTSEVFKKLFDFTGTSGVIPGSGAYGSLIQHTNGILYGLTSGQVFRPPGSSGDGTFYSLTPLNLIEILKVAGPIFVLPGVPVEILGNNLTHVIDVSFGGVPAQFQTGSDTSLIATVPMAAVDGFITATFDTGLQVQTQSAEHILPLITNLDPTSGPVGTQVGIVGGGFAGATKVTFGGVNAPNFTVVSPSLIQAIVPTGTKTGKVKVTTRNGTATSKQTFTIQ